MTRPRPPASHAAPAPEPAAAGPVPRPRPSPFPRSGPRPSPAPRGAAVDHAVDAGPEDHAVDAGPEDHAVDAGPEDLGAAPARPVPEPVVPGAPEDDRTDVWELVRRAQTGDAEGFGLLYDRYVDMVYRYLHHRVGDRSTAEDFTSETFVRALRRIDSLSFQGRDVGAWLVTIARNIVLDHVKSSRYRLEVTTADMRDADQATDGPEDAVLQRLTNAEVLAGVQQLSDEQRECLVLRFLQGLSVSETAAAMGKKDGAVKALQHRAVRRLASLLPEGLR